MKPSEDPKRRPNKGATIVFWLIVVMIGTPVVLAWFWLMRHVWTWAMGG